MSKTAVRLSSEPVTRTSGTVSPKNGKPSPLKRLKPSAESSAAPVSGAPGNADDAEVARRLHEQLNGPESPTNAPLVRHITRQRKAPTFYKPEQFGGYGGYHGTQQDPADANGDTSPSSSKQPHLSRELRRLFEHSVSMPDAVKGNQAAGPTRARAHSLPDGKGGDAENGKRRSDVKADDDTDIHSQSKAVARRQQRSQTPEKPELRLTRSMQPKETKSASAAEKARPAGSLPAKLETNSSGDKNALNQGSSGSPGKGGSSSGLQRLRNGKTTHEGQDPQVKVEATSSELGNDRHLASSSGASQSQVNATTASDPADPNNTGAEGSDSGTGKFSKHAKLPAKNPMVRQKSGGYYRVRILKEEATRVRIEFMGFEQQLEPIWLSRASERIWRGSYKNKAWKHLGDGAWAPKSGERSTAAVAHGTHQNQYTKRKALLNGAKLAADSNEAEEEADDSKDEEEQADNCADTGFAAKPSSRRTAGLSSKGTAAVKEQDTPALSQAGTKRSAGATGAALEPKESGVSSKQQAPIGAPDAQPQRATRAGRKASSGLANGLTKEQPAAKRRQHFALGRVVQNAEHSSSEMDPLDTSEPQSKPDKRNDAVTEPVSPQQLAERTSEHDAHSVPEPNVSKESASAILAGHKFASNSDKDEPVQENVPDTAEDHSTRHDPAHVAAQVTSGVDQPSSKPILATSKGGKSLSDSKAAAAQQHNVSDTTPSNVQKHNVRRGQKGALEKGPNATAAAGDAKLQPGLEEALQCEENLAEDTSASPGTAAAAQAVRDEDDKPQAAPEADSPPRPIIKPRRDRKGRIRGTYGINAKPAEASPPEHTSDPLPLPGVTRASLRPKPTAKVNPDDVASEAPSQRHHRVHASATADTAQEQPSSPLASRASAPVEARKPDRKAFQRRAAAANNAVAAAMAAEAADVSPPPHHSTHHLNKSHSQNGRRRTGSDSMNRLGLHGVRSGQISKAQSLGGSSGAGSSGALHGPFSNLMQALEEYEAREGQVPFQQPPAQAAASAAARQVSGGGGQRHQPALFDKGRNGFASNWHEPLGSGSPRILALNLEHFRGTLPKHAHPNDNGGFFHYVRPQVPLFKSQDSAG